MKILDKSIGFFLDKDDLPAGGAADKVSAGDVVVTEGLANFASKFSAGSKAPGDLGGKPDNKPNLEAAEKMKAEAEAEAQKRQQQIEEGEKNKAKADELKAKKPFIKEQIDRAREAEKERDEAKKRAEEVSEKLTETEAKIAQLQEKIDSGNFSEAKEQEFQRKIVELETKANEEKEALVNENKSLKERVRYHNLLESDEFKATYLAPVHEAYSSALKAINNEPRMRQLLNTALQAHSVSLQEQDDEARLAAEKQRDDILGDIAGNLTGYKVNEFNDSVRQYLKSADAHARAIRNWQVTAAETEAKKKQRSEAAYAERIETWDKTYKSTASEYDEEVKLSDDEIEEAEELGFKVKDDIAKMNLLARKTIKGDTGMEDAVRLIHQGRVYPVYKARVAVLEKRVKDQEELIGKLRAGGTGGGEMQTEKKVEKPTKEQFLDKFRPQKK